MPKATEANILHQVEEVDTHYSKDYANRLLQEGWILLGVQSGQEQTGKNDITPIFTYCLGRVKK